MSEAAGGAVPAEAALSDGLSGVAGKPRAEKKPKEAKEKPAASEKDKKKTTKLGLVAKKNEDFGEWYAQVCTEAELISYYNVSGCYILRPWAYRMWEECQRWFDAEIKKLGVDNAYFPLFVTPDALEREKDHVEGFAAEVAWVTRSGKTDLEVPLAIRPTSETVMYPYFAQWIRSHRDLPLKVNQWTNVVRWEFKHPTPFIRTREFLWQEGHTAFATKAEADEEVMAILNLYRQVYEDMLAVPVIMGRKSENEKFAGGLYTTTVEAFIPATGRGIQGATSHCLGQNFAKMFGHEFLDDDGNKQIPWQNSWGFTTRTLGVMIMVHGDDKGLVLPPRVAPRQAVVIPIPNKSMSEEATATMFAKVREIEAMLAQEGLRSTSDCRTNYTPGWKYNHWEVKGVPLRVELGPRDLENGTVVFVRRDTGAKEVSTWADLPRRTKELLDTMQAEMYAKAKQEFDGSLERCTTWEDAMAALGRGHMVLAPWCEEVEVEEGIRKRSTTADAMGAKSLCIPFEQPELPAGATCFASGKPAKSWGLFGRSY